MLIICNGMPRSGSTALYNLIRQHLEKYIEIKCLGFYEKDRLDAETEDLLGKSKTSDVYILKTHYELPCVLIQQVKIGQILEIYTIRNLKEIAVSMSNVWNLTVENVLSNIKAHSEIAYHKRSIAQVCLVRFEEIYSGGSLTAMQNVCSYLQLSMSDDSINSSIVDLKAGIDSNNHNFLSEIKIVWIKFVISLNKNIKLGRVLKLFLPARAVQRTKEILLLIDGKTMMHPGHVSHNKKEESYESLMSSVSCKFYNWQKEFGYD